MPIPLVLAGLAAGALKLARDPKVQRSVKAAATTLLQGLTDPAVKDKRELIPSVLSAVASGKVTARKRAKTGVSSKRRRKKTTRRRYYN